MLDLELKKFKPKRLLLLTGNDWACDFLSNNLFNRNSQFKNSTYNYVEDFGLLRNDIKFVVACHPGDKKRTKTEESWAIEVVSAFEKIRQPGSSLVAPE